MNSKLITTLTVVCLALMSVIMLEWLYATHAKENLLTSINLPTKQIATDEMPAIALNVQPEESYADLVTRPLFIKDRKPVPEMASEPVMPVSTTFDWRLSGIYTSKKGLMALLTRTIPKPPDPTGKTTVKNYKTVIVGDDVDGWKVAGIHAADIILTQGTAEKKLPLRIPKTKQTQGKNASIPATTPTPVPVTPPETDLAPQVEPEI